MTFVIDVSQHMATKDPDQQHTYLEQCQLFVCMQIMELMLRGLATAKVCIFTYGAEERVARMTKTMWGLTNRRQFPTLHKREACVYYGMQHVLHWRRSMLCKHCVPRLLLRKSLSVRES